MTFLSSMRSDEQGSAMVEMAATVGIFLLFLFGTMEFSRVLFVDLFVGYAARAATRYAMVRGATWNPQSCSSSMTANCVAGSPDVLNYVKSIAPGGIDTANSLAVSSTWPGTTASGGSCPTINGPSTPGCIVKVQITYDFHFVLPFVSTQSLSLQSTSAVTIVQ